MERSRDTAQLFAGNAAVRHDWVRGSLRKSHKNKSGATGRSDGLFWFQDRTNHKLSRAELSYLQPVACALSIEHPAEPHDRILRFKRNLRYVLRGAAHSNSGPALQLV